MVDSGLAVESNDIAFAGSGAADRVVGTVVIDSIATVAERTGAVGGGPDEVPLDSDVERRVTIAAVVNYNTVTVSRNHVAAVDYHAGGVEQENSRSVAQIQSRISGRIGADEIALNCAGGPTVSDISSAEKDS